MITLALVAALAAQGTAVHFESHEEFIGSEPIVSVWGDITGEKYPCDTISQPEGQFTYCKVDNAYIVFVKVAK